MPAQRQPSTPPLPSTTPTPGTLTELDLEIVTSGKSPAAMGRFLGSTLGGAAGETLLPSAIQSGIAGKLGS